MLYSISSDTLFNFQLSKSNTMAEFSASSIVGVWEKINKYLPNLLRAPKAILIISTEEGFKGIVSL